MDLSNILIMLCSRSIHLTFLSNVYSKFLIEVTESSTIKRVVNFIPMNRRVRFHTLLSAEIHDLEAGSFFIPLELRKNNDSHEKSEFEVSYLQLMTKRNATVRRKIGSLFWWGG